MVGVSAGGLAPHSTSTWEGCACGIIHDNVCFYVAATGNIFSFYRKKNSQAEDDADRMAARIIRVGGAGEVRGAEGRGAVPALRDASSFRLEGQRWWRCGRGAVGGAYSGPCRASYLARMFLQRPSSFLMSATSMRSAAFSFSRKPARMAIWFSFSRRASRDLLAAKLFFRRRAQYRSSCEGDRGAGSVT